MVLKMEVSPVTVPKRSGIVCQGTKPLGSCPASDGHHPQVERGVTASFEVRQIYDLVDDVRQAQRVADVWGKITARIEMTYCTGYAKRLLRSGWRN